MLLMRCFSCHEPAPETITMPHFCVRCGYPMAQPSPYLDGGEETYLPLTDDQNCPPTACSISGGFLKACQQCGRLYKITAGECTTPRCGGSLVEPSEAFPTPEGPVDGTRTACWHGHFGSKMEPKMPKETDKLSALAFRYGVLVGVTSDAVFMFQPDQEGETRVGRVRLETPSSIRSLLLDDGYALVTTEKMTYRVSLSRAFDAHVEESITENCLRQAGGNGRWLRLVERSGQKSVLVVREWKSQMESMIDLPFAASGVTSLVDGKRILLATEQNGLVLIDPGSHQCETLATPQCRWIRAALVGETIVALGFRDTGRLTLLALTTGNQSLGQYDLPENYLPDFAWQGPQIYMTTPTAIATFLLAELSRQPQLAEMRHGEETQTPLLALYNDDSETRLLVRRKNGRTYRLYLVDPMTGSTTEVGFRQESEPLFCLTDTHFVVGAYEGHGVRLRTLTFLEGA